MRWAAVVLVLLLAGCAQAPTPASVPPAAAPAAPATARPGLPGIPLAGPRSAEVSGGGEPQILADRLGRYVWIGDTSGVHVSADNGTSWHDVALPLTTIDVVFTDGIALAQDGQGRLYAASLSDNRADVSRSDDGLTFGTSAVAASAPVDRPWVAAHGDDVMEVNLNNLGAVGVGEACTHSTDAGATFTDRNPALGDPGTGSIVADDSGAFYYNWHENLERIGTSCHDAAIGLTSWTTMYPDGTGVNNLIQFATNGTAFFMAAADSGGAIVLSSVHGWSSGLGLASSAAATPVLLRLSPATLGANTFATVAARGRDVAVAWYGSTTGGDPSASGFTGDFDVFLARVHDPFGEEGGPTVNVVQLTATHNHHGQICMMGLTCTGNRGLLDYFGVAYDRWGGLHVAYVDDTGSTTTKYVHLQPVGWTPPPAPDAANSTSNSASATTTQGPTPASSRPSSSAAPASAGPVPHFQGTVSGLTLSVDGSASQGKAPLAYRWSWGDGTASTGAVASHTYAASGEYDLRLRVTDGAGRAAEGHSTVHVAADATGSVGQGTPVSVTVPMVPMALLVVALMAGAVARRSRRA